MKKLSFTVLYIVTIVAVGVLTLSAQQQGNKTPKAEFKNSVHDFGKINESDNSASVTFSFKNVGDAPLIIQRAHASCGCTTPDHTKEPILPGKEGRVTVTYSTVGRPGTFDKNVTLFTNVPDTVYVLKIKGEVLRGK